jgi:hypothetical protein
MLINYWLFALTLEDKRDLYTSHSTSTSHILLLHMISPLPRFYDLPVLENRPQILLTPISPSVGAWGYPYLRYGPYVSYGIIGGVYYVSDPCLIPMGVGMAGNCAVSTLHLLRTEHLLSPFV